jgi:hypothetical protein
MGFGNMIVTKEDGNLCVDVNHFLMLVVPELMMHLRCRGCMIGCTRHPVVLVQVVLPHHRHVSSPGLL